MGIISNLITKILDAVDTPDEVRSSNETIKFYLWFRGLFIRSPKALSSVEKYATQYGKVGSDLVQFGSEVHKSSSPYCEQNKELEVVSPSKREKADKDTPNLYLGKIIDDGSVKCEVVEIHNTNIHVKILEIYWDRLATYLDVGKTYPVFKHSGWDDKTIQVWEIAPKHMKRSTSQVLFQWEEGLGWTWDLDF